MRGMHAGFFRLVGGQFTAVLADSALLIVAMELLARQGRPAWWAPVLKLSATVSCVAFAPFAGPLADFFRKRSLMLCMNLVKLAGMAALWMGWHPLAAFAALGLGAAVHGPAKMGLASELTPASRRVAMNAWFETATVGAGLLGTVLGGVSLSHWQSHPRPPSPMAPAQWLGLETPGLMGLEGPIAGLTLAYGLALLLDLAAPSGLGRRAGAELQPGRLAGEFWKGHCRIWRDADSGLALAVCAWLWGITAVLQLVALRWGTEALGMPLGKAAWLQVAIAVGFIAGAAAAGRWIPLARSKRVLPVGMALGLLPPLAATASSFGFAWPVFLLMGSLGGVVAVPMNALLQQRGLALAGAGGAIAVQGFNENLSLLAMLAVYAGLLWLDLPASIVLAGLGAATTLAMATLAWRRRHAGPAPSPSAPGASARCGVTHT